MHSLISYGLSMDSSTREVLQEHVSQKTSLGAGGAKDKTSLEVRSAAILKAKLLSRS